MSVKNALKSFLAENLSTVVFAAVLGVLIGAWNIYISFHDDGTVAGRVVNSSGAGVESATVIVAEKTLEMLKNQQETTTDDQGYFRFEGIDMVEFIIRAEKPGYLEMKNRSYHLYFKKQNFHLPEPLVLERAQ
ncbi:MAG: carboxypeptidase regulatory-like domain-containing protein [Spirochaetales bacterium]|nr:carboxypeptidase regulatory-like domain-containing protein [Spirochaetales bacterium]